MKFFKYDRSIGEIMLDDETVFLIKEIGQLLEVKRNITKEDPSGLSKIKAFKELKYIYLFIDWESPYFSMAEQDRHNEALKDSGLTESEFNDPLFREACKKYDELQNTSLDIRLLKAAMIAVENQIYYLEHIDLQERDINGKPIFKSKDLIAEIKGCKDLLGGLRELEVQVKKGLETESSVRGNVAVGMFD